MMHQNIDSKCTVSVGIPTFNRADKLEAALKSITQQTFSNLEILISDNNSPDERVQEIAFEFCLKDSRVKYYKQKTNIGAVSNFEFVKNIANGRFFLWLSDDDYLSKDYIEKCVNFLSLNPDYSMVSGCARLCKPDGSFYSAEKINLSHELPVNRITEYFRNVESNSVFYGVYRTKVIKNISFSRVLGGDWIFVADNILIGKVKTLDEILITREASHLLYDDPWGVLLKKHNVPGWIKKVPGLWIGLEVANELNLEELQISQLNRILLKIKIFIMIVKHKFKSRRTLKNFFTGIRCLLYYPYFSFIRSKRSN